MKRILTHHVFTVRIVIYIAAIVFFLITLISCEIKYVTDDEEEDDEIFISYSEKCFWPPDMVPHPIPPSPPPDDGLSHV